MLPKPLAALVRAVAVRRSEWARQTDFPPTRPSEPAKLIYRLQTWPDLPQDLKGKEVYRVLCLMTARPVSRHWLQRNSRLSRREMDRLIALIVASGAATVIDPAGFPPA